jgi:valyl-tRNA synthetase
MDLSKNFEHSAAEQKWYKHWLDKKYFNSTPDERKAYTVVIPPPNVTGVLHMGHCLNNTIQDILVRRARMQGYNACWVPGTDHASIATETKVVQMLRERGIPKSSLSREDFLKYAWEWKEKYGGIILEQLKKMGCSLDWSRTSFTMDEDYYQSVIKVFVDLHKKGMIYRGKRMVNWDPVSKTALSDEEVIRKQTNQKLYFLKYFIDDEKEAGSRKSDETNQTRRYITIATVRPETIMGDTAICVHPNDERYKHLHGKFAFVPLINRRIPIISDDYVTIEFGTGALKVTPAHDMNDYQLGQKHKLEVIDILNDDGTLSEDAQIFVGEERFAARKKIVEQLNAENYIETIENYTSEVGYSERTDAVVEPRLSLQWWVDMKKISGPALKAVMDGEIKFHPAKFKNTYSHWMGNIKDWCISRQLWWGHRIPAWYAPAEIPAPNKAIIYPYGWETVVCETKEKAIEIFTKKYIEQGNSLEKAEKFAQQIIRQDEDCLDTWFSSWLWPFEVFKGYSNPGNADVKYYYPTSTLVTAPEIIFFWVARMIMAGYEYMDDLPFKDVYFTGIVRDKLGRKMSKSLGNSPDLLALIDQYGADAVRFGIMIASPAGNDLMFDESSLEQGRNFNNKIWNALKLVKMWEGKQSATVNKQLATGNFAVQWFENRLNEVKAEVEILYKDFKLSEALKTVYSLIWDDFCSWYLEWVKPPMNEPVDKAVYEKTIRFFEELMQLLHPFMPFVTEEIYHQLSERQDDICVKQQSGIEKVNSEILQQGILLKNVISGIRDVRNKQQIKPKETIKLSIETADTGIFKSVEDILAKQVNAESISYVKEAVANTINTIIGKDKFYIQAEQAIDTANQKEELLKELKYQQGFLVAVDKKLSNEKFVANAKPEVIELEKKKKADAEEKIKAIEESLAGL